MRGKIVLILTLFFAATPVRAELGGEVLQRDTLTAAFKALEQGKLQQYEALAARLDKHVLYPYLEYEYLRRYISSRADHGRVKTFLERWADTPVAVRMRNAWLEKLAQRGQWEGYLELWEWPGVEGGVRGGTKLSCHAGYAYLQKGDEAEAFELAKRLWQVGRSQPNVCDPLFDAWIRAGHATPERALERIELAMRAGQIGLTRYLERFLPEAERPRIAAWRSMHRFPRRELARLDPAKGDDWTGRLFVYGVRRVAHKEAAEADAIWRRDAHRFDLTDEQRAETARTIALQLAWEHHPDALERLAALPRSWHTEVSRAWRVRAALREQNWDAVLEAVAAMDEAQRNEPDWVYWQARAEAALGNEESARALYVRAAECRCFYGFLAAAQVGRPPALESVPLQVSDEELAFMADLPAMHRISALYAMGMEVEARREWRRATRDMPPSRLRAAAKLADGWGWHDQAILTLGRTEFLHDLEVRFPTPYADRVGAEAEQRELDTAFIYAVMRQESAFYPNARSRAGALGLMQLMPATAKSTGRQIRQPIRGKWDILDIDTNIRLGTAHLRYLLDRYQGNRLYTMAAYNAGPHRIRRWLPTEVMPGDVWLATMPYNETREYVKRIFAYTMVYEWRLGREPTPVSDHLPVVTPDGRPLRFTTGDGAAAAG